LDLNIEEKWKDGVDVSPAGTKRQTQESTQRGSDRNNMNLEAQKNSTDLVMKYSEVRREIDCDEVCGGQVLLKNCGGILESLDQGHR
jgi:hypothetical protein